MYCSTPHFFFLFLESNVLFCSRQWERILALVFRIIEQTLQVCLNSAVSLFVVRFFFCLKKSWLMDYVPCSCTVCTEAFSPLTMNSVTVCFGVGRGAVQAV